MAFSESVLDTRSKLSSKQDGTRQHAPLYNGAKPVHTAMRRPRFQQDFTTESFMNTAIASPSPARPVPWEANRTNGLAQGGGPSAAFNKVYEQSKSKDNNEVRTNQGRPDKPSIRPILARQYVTHSPSSMPKVVPARSLTRTPSPSRERMQDLLLSPMSEVSESSPPREFAEAYKQINDAEDLAAQDEDIDVTDSGDIVLVGENAHLSRSGQTGRRLSEGDDAVLLDSPLLQTTQDSIPSLPSDLELYEGVARPSGTMQSGKDIHRLHATLGGTRAFSKAKKQGNLVMNGLHRDDASGSGSQSAGSNTSGSILSEGSLNIPRAWGRKARSSKNWLSRVERGDLPNDNQLPLSKDAAQDENKARVIRDWQQEASLTPLPAALKDDSLERIPSPVIQTLPARSAKERVRDLAFGSSRPPTQQNAQAVYRNSPIDLGRDREIRNLAKSAVTTNRLGELKEQKSLERISRRTSANDLKDELSPRIRSSPQLEYFSSELPSQYETAGLKDDETKDYRTRARSDHKETSDTQLEMGAPRHSTSLNDELQNKEKQGGLLQSSIANSEAVAKVGSESAIHTPAPAKPLMYSKTPIVTGAWIDTPMPAIKTQQIKTEPEMQESKDFALTAKQNPDSEEHAHQVQEIARTDFKQDDLQKTAPHLPGSALAAIINRAKDKKALGINSQNDDTLLLDDSTIASLEELLASAEESDSSNSNTSSRAGDAQSKRDRKARKHRPSTRTFTEDSDSEQEIGLTSRLDRLKASIHDAKADVGSLQRRINKLPSNTSSTSASRSRSHSRARSECQEAGELHDFIWPCEKCGRKTKSSSAQLSEASSRPAWLGHWHWHPLQIYTPQLWYWANKSAFPHPTRLGWISIILTLLAITELILWDAYSPPFYATRMDGYGVDLECPRPPFILPQLLWKHRHVLTSPLDALQLLLRLIVRFVTGIFYFFSNAFATDVSSAEDDSALWRGSYASSPLSSFPAARDTAYVPGMDSDEFL